MRIGASSISSPPRRFSIRSSQPTTAPASADALSVCADSAADRVAHRWRFGRTRGTIQRTQERRGPTLPERCCGDNHGVGYGLLERPVVDGAGGDRSAILNSSASAPACVRGHSRQPLGDDRLRRGGDQVVEQRAVARDRDTVESPLDEEVVQPFGVAFDDDVGVVDRACVRDAVDQ